jgi:hypothetical protein
MALATGIAADVGLQVAQQAVDGDRIAGLRSDEQRPVDADHRGPSNGLRPAMAQAEQKPNSPVSAVTTPLAASTSPRGVAPICANEQATIKAPISTRATLSLEPMFLR